VSQNCIPSLLECIRFHGGGAAEVGAEPRGKRSGPRPAMDAPPPSSLVKAAAAVGPLSQPKQGRGRGWTRLRDG
jgi:hypothetical protein